ncbi:MAG: radical SAM protein [Candidatus Aenigmarchaeota archaeon]|nr:radical SAM protein [Candidatus Aenigmarchaeota archaeon]
MEKCRLVEQGFKQGSCLTHYQPERLYVPGYLKDTACKATLKWRDDTPYRLIHAYQHKAPECYLSIYQSGCNWSCLKCHSWDFSQYASGTWMSPDDIAKIALNYVELHGDKMYYEPRERATSWHAQELCRACGSCIRFGERSELCPGKLELDKVVLLDGGNFGPARNIISFTGGDLACQPEWYVKATEKIKNLGKNLWVLFETNGYGLTPKNLDQFKEAGIDAFWLDIKAYDNEVHKRLTGASNEWILKLPAEILDRGFVLEVSSLYIPGWVETDQLEKIAKLLVQVDENIPYAIIAFYPQYKLRNVPSPNLEQMLEAYGAAKQAGLKNIRLGNIGRFIRSKEDYEVLIKHAKV